MKMKKITAIIISIVILTLCMPQNISAEPAEPENITVFGSLNTGLSINNEHIIANAVSEYNGGVRLAMIDLNWEGYEIDDNIWNENYADWIRNRYNQLKNAGFAITLGLGTYNTPRWLLDKPGSRFVNQNGAESGSANFIFSTDMRTYFVRYLNKIKDLFGGDFSDIYAIRITSGGECELLYPSGGYWGYDIAAQTGNGLAADMEKCPELGWKPGVGTVVQAERWTEWYVKSLADFVEWQRAQLDGLGFKGWYQILTPGMGVRPYYYEEYINSRLVPFKEVLGVGAVWFKLYGYLPKDRTVVYISSVADNSGNNDVTLPSDDNVSLMDIQCTGWSATRYLVRIAHEFGMKVGGENVGYNAPPSFNDFYRDLSGNGMLSVAMKQVTAGKFQCFYWAHSDRMWDGTMPFSNYQTKISAFGAVQNPIMPQTAELIALKNFILGKSASGGQDVNGDGAVDVFDIAILFRNSS